MQGSADNILTTPFYHPCPSQGL